MDTSTHTHTRTCINFEPSFLYMLTHPDRLHGPKVTSAASRRHAAKADNVRLLLQRDLSRIHGLFRRRWGGCQAKGSVHWHYSRFCTFIQWCDSAFACFDHGTMDRVSGPALLLELAAGSGRPKSILKPVATLSIPFVNKTTESPSGQPQPTQLFQSCVFVISSAHAHTHTHVWLSGYLSTIYSNTRYPYEHLQFLKIPID